MMKQMKKEDGKKDRVITIRISESQAQRLKMEYELYQKTRTRSGTVSDYIRYQIFREQRKSKLNQILTEVRKMETDLAQALLRVSRRGNPDDMKYFEETAGKLRADVRKLQDLVEKDIALTENSEVDNTGPAGDRKE